MVDVNIGTDLLFMVNSYIMNIYISNLYGFEFRDDDDDDGDHRVQKYRPITIPRGSLGDLVS